MDALSGLEPKKVYKFFNEISSIPHGSGNLVKISNYLVEFAKLRGLKYIQDEYLNVIIFKDASSDNKNTKPVIIQGHMDMVTVAKYGYKIDFLNEPLKLIRDGDYIHADRTSLGADDGIALAFALAVLDDNSISHPPIEAVFTVDEEIGMLGASAIDTSPLKGKYFINIDSEEDGIFYAGCAGGATFKIDRPFKKETIVGNAYTLDISGIRGGHSGVEIDKQGANACQLLGRILFTLKESGFNINLFSLNGGAKDNAIATSANAVFYIDLEGKSKETFKSLSKKIIEDIKNIYKATDPLMTINLIEVKSDSYTAIIDDDSEAIINLLANLPNGVIRMSSDVEGLVETSLNLGVLKTNESSIDLTYSVRSNIDCQKDYLLSRLENLSKIFGATSNISGEYDAWEYKDESLLRDLLKEEYKTLTGKDASVEIIHAGVECGIFLSKMPDLDCVSIGPNIYDIHTFDEKMSISSVANYWKLLLNVLSKLSKVED